MDFRNFDVGLLVALDALLTEQSVSRAGERLHLSQPATSIILGRLRQYFGNPLLVRSGRRMVLTPLAESLVQPVRSCLIQIQHTVASRAEFNPAASDRKFCLAASDYVTAVLMPQALEQVARQAPRIKFELARLDENTDQKLEKGDIDFLIRPSVYAIAGHPKEALFGDTHTCVVWRRNSWIGSTFCHSQSDPLPPMASLSGPGPRSYMDPGHIEKSSGGSRSRTSLNLAANLEIYWKSIVDLSRSQKTSGRPIASLP